MTALAACHHGSPRQPVNQPDRAMVAQLQSLGEEPDGGGLPSLEPLDLEQEQILLRLDPSRAGCNLPETEKPADLIAQLRESPIVDAARDADLSTTTLRNHSPIISDRDMLPRSNSPLIAKGPRQKT